MRPKPWSPSSFDTFTTCQRKYHAEAVIKSVPRGEDTPEIKYGLYVHKAFEERLGNGKALPSDLEQYEPFMLGLTKMHGHAWAERKVGLALRDKEFAGSMVKGCDFFAKDVWWRGVIDYTKVDICKAYVWDWKTGKPHTKTRQLMQYALHTLETQPNVQIVYSYFFWTRTQTMTSYELRRENAPAAWATLVPDLTRYREAFRDDIWPPTKNGLCKDYCGVEGCEFRGASR